MGGTLNSTSTVLYIGDTATNKQYRSVLSFDTSTIPNNAVITAITLKVRQQAIVGNIDPIDAFQGIMVDIKTGPFGEPILETSDFQAAVSKTLGPFSPNLVSSWYSFNLINGKDYINKLATNDGLSQIRLRFKLDDNNNAAADYLSLSSGDATTAANRPQLVITYTIP